MVVMNPFLELQEKLVYRLQHKPVEQVQMSLEVLLWDCAALSQGIDFMFKDLSELDEPQY